MSRQPTDSDLARIHEAIRAGQKIMAVKLYREATGSDLATAKRSVEEMEPALRTAAAGALPPPALGLTAEVLSEVRSVALAGNMIAAIKRYREATGLGLAEAKSAVEALVDRAFGHSPAGASANSPASPASDTKGDAADAVAEAIFRGDKIEAIKRYREASRVGLKEAKEAVDGLEAKLRYTSPGRFAARDAQSGPKRTAHRFLFFALAFISALAAIFLTSRLIGGGPRGWLLVIFTWLATIFFLAASSLERPRDGR